jgi:hypothetical protein
MDSTSKPPEQSSGQPSGSPAITEDPSTRQEAAESNGETAGRCAQLKRGGARCGAKALLGSPFCFFHDPAAAQARAAASKRGGEHNRAAVLPSATPDFPLNSATDAAALLSQTINQVLRGRINPRIANAVGYLLTVQLKALEAGKTEERLAALEASAKSNKTEQVLQDLDDQVKSFGRRA